MKIIAIAIDKINPAPYNPRQDLRPGDPEYDKLEKVIGEFNLVEPLIFNQRTGNLVGGHQRLKILKDRGDKTVEVSVVDLPESKEKALNVALNKTGGDWDLPALKDLLLEIDTGEFDFELTGFDAGELKTLMTQFHSDECQEDETPDLPEEPITKPGDLWLLGNHRLLCGDATNAADVRKLLGGASPRIMVTDPPYGVEYDPKWRARAGVNKSRKRMGTVKNDDKADWTGAWELFDGDVAYVWHAGIHSDSVKNSLERSDFEIRSQIIWAKDRFALSRGHYHWQHEPCWYAVRKGAKGHWAGDRSQSTLWQIPAREDAGHGHGTQKPVACMHRPMANHKGDVYDPFLGSGTTLIAAEQLGRICYGMEIDPRYCDVIVKRWESFSGGRAKVSGA